MDKESKENNDNKINNEDFLVELKKLFQLSYNNYINEKKEYLENSIIEGFKQKYTKINIEELKDINFKFNLIEILLEYYFMFLKKSNLEIYFNLIIELIEIFFNVYSKKQLQHVPDKELLDILGLDINHEFKNIFENTIDLEKIFIFTGLNLKTEENNIKRKFSEIIKSEKISHFSFKEILEIFYNEKNFEDYYNLIIDIIFVELSRNSDPKFLSLYLNNLSNLEVKDSIISWKIILFNMMVYSKIKVNYKIFNSILSSIIKIINNEAEALSRRMNEILYNDKFTDFEFNMDKNIKKLNKDEYNFLLENLFTFLNFVIKFFLIKRNNDSKNNSFLKSNFKSSFKNKGFIRENYSNLCLVDLSDSNIKYKLYQLIDAKLGIEQENKNNIEFNNVLNEDLYYSYNIFAFCLDIIEFIYRKFHLLPESFSDNSNIYIEVNPFIVYNSANSPKDFGKFIYLIMEIAQKAIGNFPNFINFYISQQEIKTEHLEKIKELNEVSDSVYEIYEPFNHLGLSILIWICWKKQKNSFDMDYLNVNTEEKNPNKKFFCLVLSKMSLFDSILPVISYLIKRSQNYKYMGFEMLFDFLSILDDGSIDNLKLLKNYSYEDVYKDILEYVGGIDPPNKRTEMSKRINNLISVLSDEMKKQLILYLLRENLKENIPINDQKNSFIIYNLRIFLNNFCDKCQKENNKEKILKSSLFEEAFLKEIISLTVTTRLFVIDIFEIICQGVNFIQFCIIKDKTIFSGNLNIYNKSYLDSLEKEIEKILFFIQKWNNSNDDEKMKQVKIDTTELHTVTDFAEKRKELQNNFDLRKNQGLIAQNLIMHLNNFIFKCKREIN